MSDAVRVDHVGKVFNPGRANEVAALVDIDLVVPGGQLVSLIGPSGCGKSTLLRLIANLTEPTSGEVLVNGKSAQQARLDQDYGMAFQHAGLFGVAHRRQEHRTSAGTARMVSGQAATSRLWPCSNW